jgi:hypothetical protein
MGEVICTVKYTGNLVLLAKANDTIGHMIETIIEI